MFAKKTLCARPGSDHCQEAGHADEEGSRRRGMKRSTRSDTSSANQIPCPAEHPNACRGPAESPSLHRLSSASSLPEHIRPERLVAFHHPALIEESRKFGGHHVPDFRQLLALRLYQGVQQDQPARPFGSGLFRLLRAAAIRTPLCQESPRSPSTAFTLPSPTLPSPALQRQSPDRKCPAAHGAEGQEASLGGRNFGNHVSNLASENENPGP